MFYVLKFGAWYDWPVVGKYESVKDFPERIDDEPITEYYGPFETKDKAEACKKQVLNNIFKMKEYELDWR